MRKHRGDCIALHSLSSHRLDGVSSYSNSVMFCSAIGSISNQQAGNAEAADYCTQSRGPRSGVRRRTSPVVQLCVFCVNPETWTRRVTPKRCQKNIAWTTGLRIYDCRQRTNICSRSIPARASACSSSSVPIHLHSPGSLSLRDHAGSSRSGRNG